MPFADLEIRKSYNKQYHTSEKGRAASLRYYHKNKAKRIAYNKEWKLRNAEHVKEWQKQWRQKNDRELKNYRKKVWGLSIEQFDALMQNQNGLCAICKQPETMKLGNKLKTLCVDHNHTTGQIRGLLCNNCNVALGNIKDSIELLQQAINYLQSQGTEYYVKS